MIHPLEKKNWLTPSKSHNLFVPRERIPQFINRSLVMRRIAAAILFVLTLAGLQPVLAASNAAPAVAEVRVSPVRVKVHSAAMNRDIPVSVSLPKGYADSGLSYPVLYLLHGAGDDEMGWYTRTPVQELSDTYGIIVVTPSVGLSWYFDSPLDKNIRFETFTASELVKYMDANYRTIPRREGRALAGNSMGGHGSMFLAIRHKDTFSATAPMSGGVDIRASDPRVGAFYNNWGLRHCLGPIQENRARWDEMTVMNLVDSLKPGELTIALDCGTNDFFLAVNRQLHAKLTKLGITHEYAEFPGEHNWQYWPGSLRRQMSILDKHFKKALGSESPLQAAWKIPGDRTLFHVFLLMGQSNMAGYGGIAAGDPYLPGDKDPVPCILVLDGQGTEASATPVEPMAWRPGAHRLHLHQNTAQFGLGMDFAKAYLKTHPGVTVGLIPCAWGGAGIDMLKKGTPIFKNAMERMKFAQAQGVIKGVLWHQGESDTVTVALLDAYEGKLRGLMADVRAEANDPHLPFAIGNLAEFYGECADHKPRIAQINQMRETLRRIGTEGPDTVFVPSTGLASADKNFVHFNRVSYIEFGHRYAEALTRLQKQPLANERPGAAFIRELRNGKKIIIVTMGTSLTGGTWRWPDVMMSDWLIKDFPGQVTLFNEGVGASASSVGPGNNPALSGLGKLPAVLSHKPDVVFIEFATNDAYLPYKISLEDSRKNLNTIIDTILTANPRTEIILQTMNSVMDKPGSGNHATDRPKLADYVQGYRDIAKARGLLLVDNYPNWQKLMTSDPGRFDQLVADRIHPQLAGYREIVLPELKKTLMQGK